MPICDYFSAVDDQAAVAVLDVIVSVSDSLRELLAVAPADELTRAADLWTQTDELRLMRVDAETAAGVLADLAGLARRAQASSHHLYCWWSL